MKAPAVRLDFAGPRVRTTLPGVLLLVMGVGATTLVCLDYRAIEAHKAGLELKLATSLRHSTRDPVSSARALRLTEDAGKVATELETPWTAVLSDLEVASQAEGGISVLSIEPDHDKRRVRINGESRDLAVALAYLGKLQTSRSLRYPMLDSHEVVADNKDHPVRFAMTAEWRELP
ncbi:MAG: uncharacterized protein JWN85_5156 [Gammaproteobacteria bacterium]|nr:uncharacterized protein [Gammaproteobacteria bacterium]